MERESKRVDTIARVRRAFHVQGWSLKRIVRELHVSRNTVRKIMRSDETDFTYERERQPLPRMREHYQRDYSTRVKAGEFGDVRGKAYYLSRFQAILKKKEADWKRLQVSLVAGALNQRFLRLTERRVPKIAA